MTNLTKLSETNERTINQIKQFCDELISDFEASRQGTAQMSTLEYTAYLLNNAELAGMVCEAIHTLEALNYIMCNSDYDEFVTGIAHDIDAEIKEDGNIKFLKKLNRQFVL